MTDHRLGRVGRTRRGLGLRSTVALAFAGGAFVLSAVLSLGTYLVAQEYLVGQRERGATGAAFVDASYVREGLLNGDRQVSDVLGEVSPPAESTLFVELDGAWYSTSLSLDSEVVPADVEQLVGQGNAAVGWTNIDGVPAVVVGLPLPALGSASFYELTETVELDQTLGTIAVVLFGFAALTAIGGAGLGSWAARRALIPLNSIAGTAARIAAGEIETRLDRTHDPDLITIVGSFNSMVDALHERIERDARFNADVTHELRSPLTTLTTSVQILQRRRAELAPVSREALDLAVAELQRFRTVLEDLLELGRLDAGAGPRQSAPVDAHELARHALTASGRSTAVLAAPNHDDPVLTVEGDKHQLNRALVNLFENADLHGGGLVGVRVTSMDGFVIIDVDDSGPGVPEHDRERMFERFVRGGSRRSLPGAGLGLSLVAETARSHGGGVSCTDAPSGGARFTMWLPLVLPHHQGPAQ